MSDKLISVEEIDVAGQRFLANHRDDGYVIVTRAFLDAVEALPQVRLIGIHEPLKR